MQDLTPKILEAVTAKGYVPLTARTLARELDMEVQPREFKKALQALLKEGKVQLGKNQTIRPGTPQKTITGTFKRLQRGDGIVRVEKGEGERYEEFFVPEEQAGDAANGDEVEITIRRRSGRHDEQTAEIKSIVRRATKQFVGTYSVRDGDTLVRIDGQLFRRSVAVRDAATKGVKPNDKVVLEMIRFPTPDTRGEGVITEVLGKSGDPRVDTTSIVRALGIPDQFPEEVLAEAREQAVKFNEDDHAGRTDFTGELVISIDPVDAKDFDDAVSLTRDESTGFWILTVHIADVAAFVPPGGPLDVEARLRGTSVYLPKRVIPMFPEIISNGLASLQEGKTRYVKTAVMEFTNDGVRVSQRFHEGVIRNRKRFTYEQAQSILQEPAGEVARGVAPEIVAMLLRMRELSHILRKRRSEKGSLELSMPETVLEYDADGHLNGAHFAVNDDSHQLIEAFMLAANEAVAEFFHGQGLLILRRGHPAPEEKKLAAFAEFARSMGHKISKRPSRFDLQKLLLETADKPDRQAIHYGLLRSLKQASYTPAEVEHFALASTHYCHFTSPIRRYPDLSVHRLLGQWLAKRKTKPNMEELKNLGHHCSKTERRAENAEREAVRLRLLAYMEDRIGTQMEATITGVAEYGFFATGVEFPAEGLVRIASLSMDYFEFDPDALTLEGRKTGILFRLGDRLTVEVAKVDIPRRQLDFTVVRKKKKKG
ncbi:ribonuclease R [Zavarzinella formosa]|uniref:ribonuclease R n=1 Tax=Zavarzinella formosa TaxID=360055 RepID=UPI00036CE789|nr:ribonuclease R [Zavarzinella formosa]